jgi:hypothetical protein
MVYNDESIKSVKVNADYIIRKNSRDTIIEVFFDDKRIAFCISDDKLDPRDIKIGDTIDLKKHIYWDVEVITKDTYYLFDLSKEIINLKRIDDNIFNIDIRIENPDMIYTPDTINNGFKNLIINSDFSFNYDDK